GGRVQAVQPGREQRGRPLRRAGRGTEHGPPVGGAARRIGQRVQFRGTGQGRRVRRRTSAPGACGPRLVGRSARKASGAGRTRYRCRAITHAAGTERPRGCGAFVAVRLPAATPDQDTIGSLKASISPSNSLIGTQLQNTFLSPWTLSSRATGGQYLCWFSEGSGKAATSRL